MDTFTGYDVYRMTLERDGYKESEARIQVFHNEPDRGLILIFPGEPTHTHTNLKQLLKHNLQP